jgi:acyl-CoA oxidase
LSKQMRLDVKDQNPFVRRQVARSHLHDLEFYLNALEWREFRLLRMLVNRLQRNKKVDVFTQWNNALDLALELARAHIDRELLHEFIIVTESTETFDYPDVDKDKMKSLRPMLRSLCSLYALNNIQSNMSFYITFRYFSPVKSKAIYEELNRIISVLADYSDMLVDAFGIPAKYLGVIAGDWKAAYEKNKVPGYDVIPDDDNHRCKVEKNIYK